MINSFPVPPYGTVKLNHYNGQNQIETNEIFSIERFEWCHQKPQDNWINVNVDLNSCSLNDVIEVILPPGFLGYQHFTDGEQIYIETTYYSQNSALEFCTDLLEERLLNFAILDDNQLMAPLLTWNFDESPEGLCIQLVLDQNSLDVLKAEDVGHFIFSFWEEHLLGGENLADVDGYPSGVRKHSAVSIIYPVCQHPVVRGMIEFSVNGSTSQTLRRNIISIVGATPATELGADDPNLIYYTFRVDLKRFIAGDTLEITFPGNAKGPNVTQQGDSAFTVQCYYTDNETGNIAETINATFFNIGGLDCFNAVSITQEPAVFKIKITESLLEKLEYFDLQISERFIQQIF